MSVYAFVIIILALDFGGQIVSFEQGIEDKDIPEEREGEDSSGRISNFVCCWILMIRRACLLIHFT